MRDFRAIRRPDRADRDARRRSSRPRLACPPAAARGRALAFAVLDARAGAGVRVVATRHARAAGLGTGMAVGLLQASTAGALARRGLAATVRRPARQPLPAGASLRPADLVLRLALRAAV